MQLPKGCHIAWTPILWLGLIACGFPKPAEVAADAGISSGDAEIDAGVDAPPCSSCQLLAVEPAVAAVGSTIELEGTFDGPVTVVFPGGASQSATVLGPHRATVGVPATATTGPLRAQVGSSVLGPLPFRATTFAPGLGLFEARAEQTGGADQLPALVTARASATATVIGTNVYVVGGYVVEDSNVLSSVEHAALGADGTLGTFAPTAGSLTIPRDGHGAVIIGSSLVIVGGQTTDAVALSSVEVAPVAADGTLGPFAVMPEVSLVTAREAFGTAVIGNHLYVIGGENGAGYLNSLECAVIHADGSLGAFALAPVSLETERSHHSVAVVGDYLYVIGGFNEASGVLGSVERAAINPDGTIGAFSTVSGLTAPRESHVGVQIGDYVYVLGGRTADPGAERAPVTSDGLGPFEAVADPAPLTPRFRSTSVVVGNELYLVGGAFVGEPGVDGSIARATIDASGEMTEFASSTASTLAIGRAYAATAVVDQRLYVIGGASSGNTSLASVEQATFAADGTLGPFASADMTLVTARQAHGSAVIGNFLYVLGGGGSAGILGSVERATIRADGGLDAFQEVSGIALVTPRRYFTTAVIGGYLYVIGGVGSAGALATVERAAVGGDGSLGAFSTVTGVTLAVARFGHTSAVLGNHVYVIGGIGTTELASVEAAAINADGTLGAFSIATGVVLAAGRYGHTSAVIGSSLYEVGGYGSIGDLSSVERAAINTDGTIGPFSELGGATLSTARDGHASAVVGNTIYEIGGDGASYLNDVESAQLQ